MILVIISHTEHYTDSSGNVMGWGATIREIDHLTEVFGKVIHLAPLYTGEAPAGLLPYLSDRVEFVPLIPAGGKRLSDKLGIIMSAPRNLSLIRKKLRECDVFQFRAPTGMGMYTIPYLILFSGKKGWFKYAGNWIQENPPLSYKCQKWMLAAQSGRVVTINGAWPGQRRNQFTFENPCLTTEERDEGRQAAMTKNYSGKLDFVFIGRLEDAKGVQRILNVFSEMDDPRIGKIHLVGDGEKRSAYEKFAREKCCAEIVFHGFLPRAAINCLLTRSHVFLLPSDSEGFPKVVAEAANYGVIPIVSDVSSVGQYIKDGENGFLIPGAHEDILRNRIGKCLSLGEPELRRMALCGCDLAGKFTYARYNQRIREEIIEWE